MFKEEIEQLEKEKLSEELGIKPNDIQVNSGREEGYTKKYSGLEWGVCTKEDVLKVLGQTVRQDDNNKLIVFLTLLLTYTETNQLNIAFNAPSSSGKSYLALEVASLFPKEDVIEMAYASPASFFHTVSSFDQEKKVYIVDLHRKILIFLDMPHPELLERLRSLFSHDKQEILVKIVDKKLKFGIQTKDILLKGYPSVIFCSASFRLDEQEQTRFLLLSPELSQEKLREAITEKIKKEANTSIYFELLNQNPDRQKLIARIKAIKEANIKYINLHDPQKLETMFYERNKVLKPRHARDITRISSLAKAFALLNLWNRNYNPDTSVIVTNDQDCNNAFNLWDQISKSQELGLPPYLLNLYFEVILSAFEDNGGVKGVTRKDVLKKHFQIYGRHLQDDHFRKDIIPILENSGIIAQEEDELDKRRMLIHPLLRSTISQEQTNSESDSGVNPTKTELSYVEKVEYE